MRDKENVQQVADLAPDFMGFIFYEGSKRNIGNEHPFFLQDLDDDIRKVGVFVNEDIEDMEDKEDIEDSEDSEDIEDNEDN